MTPTCPMCRELKVYQGDDSLPGRFWSCESDKCAKAVADLAVLRSQGKYVCFGAVPGGTSANSWRPAYQKSFDKGVHGYKAAKDAGLQPDAPTPEAIDKAEMRAESLERVDKMVDKGLIEVTAEAQ